MIALTPKLLAGCFETFPSGSVFTQRIVCRDGLCLWQVHMFGAVVLVPSSGSSCDEPCSVSSSNITVTGGILSDFSATPSQIPPEGGLMVMDCLFEQIPGATNATILIENSCLTLSGSFDYPELIQLRITNLRRTDSEVALEWNSRSNTLYQVQYSSDLDAPDWQDLGEPIVGNGTTNSMNNLPGSLPRFYRIIVP